MSDTLPNLSATPDALSAPALVQRAKAAWRPWIVLWSVTAFLQILLLMNNASLDTFLWRTTRWVTGDQNAYKWDAYKKEHAADVDAPFYTRVDPPWTRMIDGTLQGRIYKRTETFWRVMRDPGEPVMTGLIVLIVCIYDRRGIRAGLLLLAATSVAGLLGWLIRASAGRFRPINLDGANSWQFMRGFTETRDLSWPSGHATLAFATAAALTYLSPRGKWLFITVAAGCALSRVVMQAHFYADVIFGGGVGWTFGWMTMVLMENVFGKKAV
jgi:membrane-associated phospholipid phosphatase